MNGVKPDALGRVLPLRFEGHPQRARRRWRRLMVRRRRLLLIVSLNGTSENRLRKFLNLQQSPYPQGIAKPDLYGEIMQLNSLDGDPLRSAEDIRERLRGWSEDVIHHWRRMKP